MFEKFVIWWGLNINNTQTFYKIYIICITLYTTKRWNSKISKIFTLKKNFIRCHLKTINTPILSTIFFSASLHLLPRDKTPKFQKKITDFSYDVFLEH